MSSRFGKQFIDDEEDIGLWILKILEIHSVAFISSLAVKTRKPSQRAWNAAILHINTSIPPSWYRVSGSLLGMYYLPALRMN